LEIHCPVPGILSNRSILLILFDDFGPPDDEELPPPPPLDTGPITNTVGFSGIDSYVLGDFAADALTGSSGDDNLTLFGIAELGDSVDGAGGNDSVSFDSGSTGFSHTLTIDHVEQIYLPDVGGGIFNLLVNGPDPVTISPSETGTTRIDGTSSIGEVNDQHFTISAAIDGSTAQIEIEGAAGNDSVTFSSGNDTVQELSNVEYVHDQGGDLTFQGAVSGVTISTAATGGTLTLADFTNTFTIGQTGMRSSSVYWASVVGGNAPDTDHLTVSASGANTTINSLTNVEFLTGSTSGGSNFVRLGGSGQSVNVSGTFSTLQGSGGTDVVTFGDGTTNTISNVSGIETIIGGTGNDTVAFSGTVSSVTLEGAIEQVTGSSTADTVVLSSNGATLSNISAIETITGGSGTDTVTVTDSTAVNLSGGDGNKDMEIGLTSLSGTLSASDFLVTASGDTVVNYSGTASYTFTGTADLLFGSSGADTLTVSGTGTSADTVDGGAGTDHINLSGGSTTFAVTNIESITGAASGDTFTIANTISGVALRMGGGGSTDTVNLADGGNTFSAWEDIEVINGGSGNEVVTADSQFFNDITQFGGSRTRQYDLGGGTDTITIAGSGGAISLSSVENLTGSGNDDNVTLTAALTSGTYGLAGGTDSVVLANGTNSITFTDLERLTGGTGADTIVSNSTDISGGTYAGGDGTDSLQFIGGATLTSANLANVSGWETWVLGTDAAYDIELNDANVASGETLTIDASAVTTATNALEIDGVNELDGKLIITGGAGNDTLDGGDGADTIDGGAGNDDILGDHGVDRLKGNTGDDILTGGGGADTAVMLGAMTGYSIGQTGGSQQVVDTASGTDDDGTDTLRGIHNIEFTDGTITLDLGNVLTFDGSNDSISITQTGVATGSGDFTYEAIFKTSTSAGMKIIKFGDVAGAMNDQAGGITVGSDGTISATLNGTAGQSSTVTVNDGNWHHVAAVMQSGTLTVYVDGEVAATKSGYSPNIDGNEIFIGQNGASSQWFNGQIGEVRFWNDARDSTEIQQNFEITLQGTEPNLVGYWPLDDTGSTAENIVSGGANGTISGATSGSSTDRPVGEIESITGTTGGDTVTLSTGFTDGETVDLGSGTDSLTLADATNTLNVTNTETITGGSGADAVTALALFTTGSTVDLGGGSDTLNLLNSGTNVLSILNTESVTMGSGDNAVSLENTVSGIVINGGAGTNTVQLTTGTHSLGLTAVEVLQSFGGNDTVTLTNAQSGLSVVMDAGTDSLTLAAGGNTVTVTGAETITGGGDADDVTLGAAQTTGAIDLGAGTTTGYDTITGFSTSTDIFNVASALDTLLDDLGTNGSLTFVSDAAANFTSTHEALKVTGLSDANLLDLSSVTSAINSLGVTSTSGDDALIVAHGASDTAVYYFQENGSSANNVESGELSMLALIDAVLVDTTEFTVS